MNIATQSDSEVPLRSEQNPFACGLPVLRPTAPIQTALTEILSLIKRGCPIIVAAGHAGSGKTTLINLIAQTCTGKGLSIRIVDRGDLIERYTDGPTLDVLLVDESESIPDSVLPNLNCSGPGLAKTCVFACLCSSVERFRNSAAHVVELPDLSCSEAEDLLLQQAATIGIPELFGADALGSIVAEAHGSLRLLRSMASLAFFSAACDRDSRIRLRHVDAALQSRMTAGHCASSDALDLHIGPSRECELVHGGSRNGRRAALDMKDLSVRRVLYFVAAVLLGGAVTIAYETPAVLMRSQAKRDLLQDVHSSTDSTPVGVASQTSGSTQNERKSQVGVAIATGQTTPTSSQTISGGAKPDRNKRAERKFDLRAGNGGAPSTHTPAITENGLAPQVAHPLETPASLRPSLTSPRTGSAPARRAVPAFKGPQVSKARRASPSRDQPRLEAPTTGSLGTDEVTAALGGSKSTVDLASPEAARPASELALQADAAARLAAEAAVQAEDAFREADEAVRKADEAARQAEEASRQADMATRRAEEVARQAGWSIRLPWRLDQTAPAHGQNP
jgi:hypothetical protein